MDQELLRTIQSLPMIRNKSRIKVTVPVQTIAIESMSKEPQTRSPIRIYKSEQLRPKRSLPQLGASNQKLGSSSSLASAMQQYEFPLIQNGLPKYKPSQPKFRRKGYSLQNSSRTEVNPVQNNRIRSIILNIILEKKNSLNEDENFQGVLEPFKTKVKALRNDSPRKGIFAIIEKQLLFPMIKQGPTRLQEKVEKTLVWYQGRLKVKKPKHPPHRQRKNRLPIEQSDTDPLKGWQEGHDVWDTDNICS